MTLGWILGTCLALAGMGATGLFLAFCGFLVLMMANVVRQVWR